MFFFKNCLIYNAFYDCDVTIERMHYVTTIDSRQIKRAQRTLQNERSHNSVAQTVLKILENLMFVTSQLIEWMTSLPFSYI